MFLVADVGGTNVRVAHVEGVDFTVCQKESYSTLDYHSLESIIHKFQTTYPSSVNSLVVGVAGPVVGGKRAELTNLDWIVDSSELSKKLAIENVYILNDLEAHAYGLNVIRKSDLFCLQVGSGIEKANKAVIASGTGLGESFLVWFKDYFKAFPTEGGHCDFGPDLPEDAELWSFLRRAGHVSWEAVASGGLGIPNIYRYLKEVKNMEVPSFDKVISENPKSFGKVVFEEYKKGHNVAKEILERFVRFYGAEAGNLALKVLATGGMYVAGGIASQLREDLIDLGFLDAFLAKGRFTEFMSHIPLNLVTDADLPLRGAAFLANIRGS